MTTVNDVFDLTLPLIDAVDDVDVSDYKNKTLGIINVLRGELFPFSDTWKYTEKGKRPIVTKLTSFTDEIGLDDYICQTILPYGLAAHLMLNEDSTTASFCQQRYEELLKKLSIGMPQESEEIEDVYSNKVYNPLTGEWEYRNGNGIGFEWMSRW